MAQEDSQKLRLEKGRKTGIGRRRRRWLYWSSGALLFILVLVLLFKITGVEEVRAGAVSLTYPSQAITVLNASGYVVAQRKAALASKTTGRLVWLGVEEGSRVEKGQVVARLENEDLSAALSQARANLNASREGLSGALAELDDAQEDFQRKKSLLEGGFIARSLYDQAEARLKKAQASADASRAQVSAARAAESGAEAALGYTFIRAPFSGVVLTKNADIGDIITPLGAAANAKAAVVTIADLGTLQVEVDVAESNINKVRKEMHAEIQLDALPDERFPGKVHMIVPTADRTKASVLVKVAFLSKDPKVMPEMSAKVSFLTRPVGPGEDEPLTTVPAAAVVSQEGRDFVFVVDGERAKKTQVKIGRKIGDSIEVSGVSEGQSVIISVPEGLRDGEKVSVLEE